MRDIALENEKWAKTIVNELYGLGINYFCISPGSRSSTLAYAIAEHPYLETFIHYDERGLAFHALGYAKASGKPVTLLVTSGTAVANLFPAILEASEAKIPLVILTADRPPELRGCGANQTTDQVHFFSSHVRFFVDLPCPDPLLPQGYLAKILAQGMYLATHDHPGPVHFNCMFREPLVKSKPIEWENQLKATFYEPTDELIRAETLNRWGQLLSNSKRGLIITGSLPNDIDKTAVIDLAHQLKWPLLADINSSFRGKTNAASIVTYFDLILKTFDMPFPELVLHLGDRFVSKTLQEWLSVQTIKHYLLVTHHSRRHDPQHLVSHRLQCDVSSFCKQIINRCASSDGSYLELWQKHSDQIGKKLNLVFSEKQCSEPNLIWSLKEKASEQMAIYLSNSMPIRDADLFFFPEKSAQVFSNRGVSGIDGNIATAIGLAQGLKKPLIAILGDLACLHDLNSLAQLKKVNYPVLFLIINNGGGGIFSFLPAAKRKKHFEKFMATVHDFSFESAAKLFRIPYHFLEGMRQWETLIDQFHHRGFSCLAEVITDREKNVQFHQTIYHHLKMPLPAPTLQLV